MLILGTHAIFIRMSDHHTHNEAVLSQRLTYLNQIETALFKIESYVYATTAATNTAEEREQLQTFISKERKDIDELLVAIKKQNNQLMSIKNMKGAECQSKATRLARELHVNLNALLRQVATLNTLLSQRDTYIKTQDNRLQNIAKNIRIINKKIPEHLQNSHALILEVSTYTNQRMQAIEAISQKAKKHYFFAEILLNILYALGILYLLYRIFQNIIRLYQTLERQLTQDQLTKLPNRFSLLKDMEGIKEPLLCILDINHFHLINELYGTEVGNHILLLMSKRLAFVTQNDPCTLYRISSDEFVLLNHENDMDISSFTKKVEEYVNTVEKEPFLLTSINDEITLRFSCGIAKSANNALGHADMALNRAKKQNMSATAIYDEMRDSIDSLEDTKKWKNAIEKGLQDNTFIPYFQPIFDAKGQIIRHEALLRLHLQNDFETIVISPLHFLELSKKMRTYHQVSTVMLLKTLDIVIHYRTNVNLNICYQDIINQTLTTTLKEKIEKNDIGQYLTFELIESEDIEDYERVKEFMEIFRALGVRIALDDFGSGFSNFNYILTLAPDCIKIDGSLIKNIHQDTKSKEMVKAICSFSKSLGITTVAEFVHNKEVFEVAKEIGIDYFQGYYFAEPSALLKNSL